MGYWKAALVVNVAFFGTFSVIMLFSLTTVCGDWLPFMDISKIDSDSLYDFKTTVDAIARILGIETLAFLSGPLLLGADPLMFQTCFLIFVVVGIWPMVGFVFFMPICTGLWLPKAEMAAYLLVIVPLNVLSYRELKGSQGETEASIGNSLTASLT